MPRRKPSIVVIGSSNTDLTIDCPHLPRPGETIGGGNFRQACGGKGANQAVAASRAGAKVFFVGCRGDDSFGTAAEKALRREKIDVRFFRKISRASSGVALILVGGTDRQNLIAVAKSANDMVAAKDVQNARREVSSAKIVLCQLEIPLAAVTAAAKLARSERIPFMLNPAPAKPLPKALYPLIDIITPNEHEAKQLTGEKDIKKAARKLLEFGCGCAVITLGAKGALLVDQESHVHFPAPQVRAVDTVGAGDCFSGWLAAGLAEGLHISQSMERALRASAISVTRAGAQPSLPYRGEIQAK